MENSSTPFTDMLNTNPPPNTQNKEDIPQQISAYPPPHFHMNFPPQHYGYQPHHPQNYMPFGGQGSYQQPMAGPQPSYQQLMAGTQPSYQQLMALGSHVGAPYVGNVGQYPQAALGGGTLGGPSSPVGSSVFFGAAGGSSSRCDDSGSPMSSAPYSPISPAQFNNQPTVRINEASDDGDEASVGRQRWSKQQNLRLVGAWLKHSVDPIHGNNKKSDHY